MPQGVKQYLVPALLLLGAVVVAPFEPLATVILFAVSLATFFGVLSARTAGREPRRVVLVILAVCILIVPLQTLLDVVRGQAVDLRHETMMFAASLLLVFAFLAGRWLGRRR